MRPDTARRYTELLAIQGFTWTELLQDNQAALDLAEPPELHQPSFQNAIPEIDIRAGMGGGGEQVVHYVPDGNGGMSAADDIRAEWNLPEDYIRSELRVSPATARIIEVQGDSMEPTLRSGERVMVNMADARPSPPGIFALWDGYGIVVKRIEHIPNSDPPMLRISSDNSYHREYERTADEVKIIGRVVWAARRL